MPSPNGGFRRQLLFACLKEVRLPYAPFLVLLALANHDSLSGRGEDLEPMAQNRQRLP